MNDVGSAINDLLVRAWRRKWLVVLPFVALFSGAIALALLLPPVYQSSATIVIEDSAVPGELVGSTISSGADKRLKIIEQRVMATDNLLRIVRAYGLYAEDQKTDPITSVIDAMREKITMELISADVTASSREASPTIAFKVYFEHENPAIAQRVANELANLYLSENVRERQEKATDTVSFLATEAKRLEANIVEMAYPRPSTAISML